MSPWYERAAFLDERIAARPATAGPTEHSREQAASIAKRWRAACAAKSPERFARRLAHLGLETADIGWLSQAPAAPDRPTWADTAASVAARARVTTRTSELDQRVPFGSLLQPWIEHALDLLAGCTGYTDALRSTIGSSIGTRLRRCGEPVILTVFRDSGQGYADWVDGQLADGFAELFDTVPVWGRLAATATENSVVAFRSFFDAWQRDQAIVRRELMAGDDSPLAALELHGDPHNGGLQVVVAETANGTKLVYKPRSLAPERIVIDVADHLRSVGGMDYSPVAPTIDRGDHGWMAWVEAQPLDASNRTEFSRRAGSLLSLCRVLAITDIHDENVLPVVDRPILIDLECLGTSRVNDRKAESPEGPSQELIDRSVLRSDLLVDARRFTTFGRDCSGLTGIEATGVRPVERSYRWTGLGTDDIELHRSPPDFRRDEPAVDLDIAALREGIELTDAAIAAHGIGIPELEGEAVDARPVPLRALVHDTSFYAELLDKSLTPWALSDGLHYSIALDRVAAGATEDDATEWRLAAAEVERRAMEHHDIPIFHVDWSATSGWTSDHTVPELVDESGLDTIRRRIADTTAEHTSLQGDLASMALTMRYDEARERAGQILLPQQQVEPAGERRDDSPLGICEAIVERLEATAFAADSGGLGWLDVDYPKELPAPALTDDGLGAGNAGVALFLAAHAVVTGSDRRREFALRTIRGAGHFTDDGLYVGTSGRGYGLVAVGRLLGDHDAIERGIALLRSLPEPAAARARGLDFLFGLPGIAGALGSAATMTGDDRLAVLATDYCAATEKLWREVLDRGRQGRTEALRIGPAHGITGVELGAARVFQAVGERWILDWIEEMVEAENERVERRDRVPARLDANTREPDRGWCWGASGYVMSREAVHAVTGLPAALFGVAEGRALASEGDGRSHRLCCGRAGQELAAAGSHLGELCSRPLDWSFEKDHPHQNASLLRGTAGVGIALLRNLHPERVPNPLTLQPVFDG